MFDDGADVAVDTANSGQPVTEPFGLGNLRDAILDEPGLVAVPERDATSRELMRPSRSSRDSAG
ncbi:hypothetical protein KRM28CT15_52480 [Krasilnikovia sp. M28-CT-15]